jgi:hypothetical protein
MSCINNFGDINETFIIEPLVLDDTFVTGFTLSSNNIVLTQNRIDQYSAFTITLSGLTGSSLNVYVTGGTYNNTTGTATFVNSTGGTFQVTGFTTGSTSSASGDYLPLSGGTVTGDTIFQSGLTASTISATTISGGTFYGDGSQLTGIVVSAQFTGGTVSGPTNFLSGLTANTISATTYYGITNPTNDFIPVNSGGTFQDSFLNQSLDILRTRYNGNNIGLTIDYGNNYYGLGDNSQNYLNDSVSELVGVKSSNSATTYFATDGGNQYIAAGYNGQETGLRLEVGNKYFIFGDFADSSSGATFVINSSNGSHEITTNNNGSTDGLKLQLSNKIYDFGNLTGGNSTKISINDSQKTITLTNLTASTDNNVVTIDNSGILHTYPISGLTGSSSTSGAYLPLSGGTVSGDTIFNSGLTANTISATTYENLPNTLYTGDGVLSSDRLVDLSGRTLNFSSSTSANNLVLSGGNVGIGTATPNTKLDVNGWINSVSGVSIGGASWSSGVPLSGGKITFVSGGTLKYSSESGAGFSHSFFTNGFSRLFINDTGVGIGTTSPSYKLDVQGTGRFTNELYADTNLYVNNYFQIDTTSTVFPTSYPGIWRRKGNGFGTYFLEDEQGGPKDKWAFVQRQGYGGTREWYGTNSSIVNINYGWQTPNEPNFEGATLLIDPVINITGQTGTKVRGIYYNPTISALTGTTHIAFENKTGDIIFGNLSGGTTRMVVADSTGKLSTQVISNAVTFTGGTVSGPTVFQSGLTANTISATTYENLPTDVFVTGGTYSAAASTLIFTNNTGGTFNVSGITTSTQFTGGTVSGNTIFTSGLSANTLTVTGNTRLAGLTANTLNVTGSTKLDGVTADTLTVTGNTRLAGLTANTISATTYLNLPVTADTFVTGFTLSSNTITLRQNRTDQYSAFTISLSAYTGSSTSVSGAFLPLSGGTVTGNTVFTSGLTANTISATTYNNLPNTLYTGNGFLNSDRIVDLSGKTLNFSSSTSANNLVLSGGSVGIGTATPSASALFEISSTTKGFLGPRMTEAQRLAIAATTGLIVYQTDADEGYFLYKSFGWVQIM